MADSRGSRLAFVAESAAMKWLNGRALVHVEPWPRGALSVPRLQSHRGFHITGLQENTLVAFREARAQGALMVETDVRLSKDQVPVLCHDEDIGRFSTSADPVSLMTVNELKEKARLSTLQELLSDEKSPRLVNIELKSKAIVEDALERRVAEVVRRSRAQNRVLFSSFNPFSLYRISLHLPDVPRALLVTPEEDKDNSIFLRRLLIAPLFSFHLLHLDQKMLTESSMALWRRKKIPVSVWTVNGKQNIQRYLQMGCLSVISDEWNSETIRSK
jgi:glycerophosphoryl diester phosphodiesterase